MKQIQIENGVIRYYGNRVGRVTEGCAVVDPMFQNEALESFLRKQRNIQKIQWQDGIYDRLANSQEDMESAKGLKDVRIWQLRGDVDVHMKFLALSQMEQQYGSPKPDFYIKVYEGASDTKAVLSKVAGTMLVTSPDFNVFLTASAFLSPGTLDTIVSHCMI